MKELRAEHASDLRARDMQLEKMRARLERALAEVEEWRRVASEGEVHRRRASEVRAPQGSHGPPTSNCACRLGHALHAAPVVIL